MSPAMTATATIGLVFAAVAVILWWTLFCVDRWMDRPARMLVYAFAPIVAALWLIIYLDAGGTL